MPQLALVGILRKKRLDLSQELLLAIPPWIALDLIESYLPSQLVFADQINFLRPLTIPPRPHVHIRRRLRELPLEVSLERISAERVKIPQRNVT